MHALHAVGGKARVVHSYTDAACNSYNNGHTMLEVWDEKTNSYVLVDTDKKTSFSLNDAPVNLFDFSQAIVQQKPYAIGCPSNAAMLDAVGFTNDVGNFDYGALELFWGSSPEAMRLFYQRVASFPAISEEGVLYVCAWNEGAKHADIFKQLHCELLEPDAFCQRFYTL